MYKNSYFQRAGDLLLKMQKNFLVRIFNLSARKERGILIGLFKQVFKD